MKKLILFSCILFCCTSAQSQVSSNMYDFAGVSYYSASELLNLPGMYDRYSKRKTSLEAPSEDMVTQQENLQESKLACEFIIHPKLHSNRYLLIRNMGPSISSCFVTNEINKVVYKHPLALSNSITWIDLSHLESGDYYINVKIGGVAYQQVLEKRITISRN